MITFIYLQSVLNFGGLSMQYKERNITVKNTRIDFTAGMLIGWIVLIAGFCGLMWFAVI